MLSHTPAPHSRGSKCPMCSGGACKYAKGGEVKKDDAVMDTYARKASENHHEEGVHKVAIVNERHSPGESDVGNSLRTYPNQSGKKTPLGLYQQNGRREEHKRVLREQKTMPKPTAGRSGFAKGGEIGNAQHDEPKAEEVDTELSHGLGKELMGALDSKDHKKVMSALEACVLHCMSKGESDV